MRENPYKDYVSYYSQRHREWYYLHSRKRFHTRSKTDVIYYFFSTAFMGAYAVKELPDGLGIIENKHGLPLVKRINAKRKPQAEDRARTEVELEQESSK